MGKKKLLMITCDGGIAFGKQNVFFEMLKDFSSHFERISIICPSNEIGKEIKIHNNVYLYPSGITRKFHLDFWLHKNFVVRKGLEIFKTYGFDLIDAHFLPPLLSQLRGGIQLSKLTNRPFITEFMHLPGLPKSSCFQETFEKMVSIFFLKLYKKKIKDIRIINRGQVETYFKNQLHFRAEQLHFISSIYLDLDIFKQLHLDRKPNLFVTAGRLAQNKGLFLILDAILIVRDSGHHDIRLKIVGDGPLKNKLTRYIDKHRLKSHVELLGWLPTQRDVAQLYNSAKASIMASYNEGGPRVVFESMACGTPVLTTRVGETNEIIRDGFNGLFIDWNAQDIAEKICYVLENPSKLEAMRIPAFETVQAWEKKKVLSQYAQMLYKIMGT